MSPERMNAEVVEKLRGADLVVDVRSPEEFASGHLDRALNIPVGDLLARIGEFGSKSNRIVVYCHSGGRSSLAAQMLGASGFLEVFNAGGYNAAKGVDLS